MIFETTTSLVPGRADHHDQMRSSYSHRTKPRNARAIFGLANLGWSTQPMVSMSAGPANIATVAHLITTNSAWSSMSRSEKVAFSQAAPDCWQQGHAVGGTNPLPPRRYFYTPVTGRHQALASFGRARNDRFLIPCWVCGGTPVWLCHGPIHRLLLLRLGVYGALRSIIAQSDFLASGDFMIIATNLWDKPSSAGHQMKGKQA